MTYTDKAPYGSSPPCSELTVENDILKSDCLILSASDETKFLESRLDSDFIEYEYLEYRMTTTR